MPDESLIVFDLDGTLYRTAEVTVQAVVTAAGELGLAEPPEAEILAHMGIGIGDLVQAMFPGLHGHPLEHARLVVRRHERTLIREKAALFHGIRELLEGLRDDGQGIAVCSNGSLEYILAVLGAIGITDLFNMLESGSADSSKSAAVARIRKALGPGRLVLVGDTPQDRRAAEDNDIPFIAAMYGYGAANLSDCSMQAHDVAELATLLEEWRS